MKYLVELVDSPLIENKEFEYKLKLESDKDKIEKWAKSLVGFANTDGGFLFVGVNNDGIAIGLSKEEIDNSKNLILKTINRYIFPHIQVSFLTYPCEENKGILSVFVPPSREIVIYKAGDFNEKVYIREDGATIPASIAQILSMGKRKFGFDYQILDEQYQKSNFKKYNKLATTYREDEKEPSESDLMSEEVVAPDGRITQGLKMFSDDYKSDETLTVCRLWDGYDKGENQVIDKKECSGCLCDVFTEAMNFIKRNSRSGFIKNPDGSRLDTKSYPEQALREALVNALAHRDYSIEGTQVDIDIYKDRLEISSPGSWLLSKKPSEYRLEKIPSIRRNKIICSCFEAAGLMEKSGSGFKKIYKVYEQAGGKEPMLEDESDFFVITLYDLLADEEKATPITGKYDEEILDFCNGVARSREEIQAHIGYKSRSHFMKDVLKPMLDAGLIIPTSSIKSKNLKYITKRKNPGS